MLVIQNRIAPTGKLKTMHISIFIFKIRTQNQLQAAKIVPCSKLVSNIAKSNQIFNFSLPILKEFIEFCIDFAIFDTSLLKGTILATRS